MNARARRKNEIILLIRRVGRTTRPIIGDMLSISPPTVSSIIRDLVKEKWVVTDGYKESVGGRRAALFKLNPKLAYSVGIEMSLSAIAGVLIDLEGHIFARHTATTAVTDDWPQMRNHLLSTVEKVLLPAKGAKVAGIGLGISGIFDKKNKVLGKFPQFESWVDLPVGRILEEKFGLNVVLENNVTAAALAELKYGRGRQVDNFLYLHMGKAIGLGIVINGEIYQGATGAAGELGHIIIDPDGPICYCGNYGCLESLASPPALIKQAIAAIEKGVESKITSRGKGKLSQVTINDIFEAAANSDRLASNILEKAGEYMGLAMANLGNLFNPQMFVLGGILAEDGGFQLDAVRRVFRSRVLSSLRDVSRIEASEIGERPCPLGAATLVYEEMFERLKGSEESSEVMPQSAPIKQRRKRK
jgi:predicted NBD/HSP70 family sugar kinase